jgi:hypothetical protein
MSSCTLVRRFLVGALFLLLPLDAAPAQPPATPTDAEVRERMEQLDRKKVQPARLEALRWLRNHAAAKKVAMAIPVLERTIREDPVSEVREEAVLALFHIARKHKLPCPLALVEAIFDEEFFVRQDAASVSTQFSTFAPGTVELALRGSWSEDTETRSCGLNLLALAAPRDPKALAVIETAKNDRNFQVRHNAHCFKFLATGRLEEYLVWLIRVQEDDRVLDPIPKEEELRKREECVRNLAILGSAQTILEWTEKRPDDLADALLVLLEHKSSVVRHGAVRLIRATAVQSDLSKPKSGENLVSKVPSFLFPESESGAPKPGGQPKPRLEMSKVAARLQERKVRERLEKLSQKDPDSAVQGAALLALDRLARLGVKP